MTTRRDFITKGCAACMGVTGLAVLLQSCGSSLPVIKSTIANQSIEVPVSSFTDKNTLLLVRNPKLENDILLIKEQNSFKALYLKCTHEGVALTATQNKIYCTAHGSIFDFEGNVLKEPALRPLKVFRTSSDARNVIIHLI